MNVAVIVNVGSRRGRDAVGGIRTSLARHGLVAATFREVTDHPGLRRAIRDALDSGAETVVVGGGDGTVSGAAGELAFQRAVLGVLPLGTGNSFARTLGIPVGDVDRAVQLIAARCVRKVDLGVVNGRYFANFATVGFSANVAGTTPNLLKRLTGPLAYVLSAAVQVVVTDAFAARLRSKAGKMEIQTRDIVVVNGRYYGSVPIAPDATDVSGRLVVYTTQDPSRFGLAAAYAAIAFRRTSSLPSTELFSVRKLRVKTRPRQNINIDGEIVGRTPAIFRVAHRALRVIVSKDFGDGRV